MGIFFVCLCFKNLPRRECVKLIDISSHRQSADFEESNPERPDEDNIFK